MMLPEYEKEIADLKARMEKAEVFAENLPAFRERIIKNKFTGEEAFIKLGDRYKQISLAWGINRILYIGENTPLNYPGSAINGYLTSIYINCYDLFDLHCDFDLINSIDQKNYFHYDFLNSTFYSKDETLESLLEQLNDWYLGARQKAVEAAKQKRRDELEKQLAELDA